MRADDLQSMVVREGIENWHRPGWQESGGLRSIVAAHQYRLVLGLLERYLTTGAPKDVLDWGCGSGAFSYALATEGHQVSAIDPRSPPMQDFISAATKGRFRFLLAEDPVIFPYEDDSFDVVLSNGCLEHVGETGGNDMRSLEETFRVLRPGGVFICCHLPNRSSYIEAVARAIKRPMKHYFNRFVYSHQFLYSRPQVETMAAEAGYAIEYFARYGFVPRNPLSSLPSWMRDSSWFIWVVDWVDAVLEKLFPSLCQNLAWVGRKPS